MLSVSVRSCRVRVSFSCFALLAFFCIFAGGAGSAFFCLAVLLHECAHIVTLCLFHAPPQKLTLSAMGCRLVPQRSRPLTPLQSAAVSVSAPLCNLLTAFLFMPILGLAHPFTTANLSLGLFHALPILPLDGGLCLRSLLSAFFTEKAANRISLIVSLTVLFPLSIFGFLLLLRTHYNFSLLALSVYLMLYLLLREDLTPP